MKLLIVPIVIAFAMAPSFGRTNIPNAGKGQKIFQDKCVGCHGTDGRAQTDMGKKVSAADLTSGAVQHQSDSQLATIVKDGKSKMPSFDQKLSDAEVRSVIAYIRRIAKAH
jgi:cytochrome c6